MRLSVRFALPLLMALAVSGCRYKGWESFTSATTPNAPVVASGGRALAGDPYAFGGVGSANGGLKPETNYGIGSDANSAGRVNASFDQPEKGSGQQPGDYPNEGGPGAGKENGPALQPTPDQLPTEGAISHG